ncbi:MAG: hypothetical protein AB7R55_19525 [Gemmatimonadales bacterium]
MIWKSTTVATVLVALVGCRPERPADWVIRNTAVYTMTTSPARVEAIAIRDGLIAYLGSNAGADSLVGDSTEVIDLGGRMVLPGFHDTHVHPSGGIGMGECNLDG